MTNSNVTPRKGSMANELEFQLSECGLLHPQQDALKAAGLAFNSNAGTGKLEWWWVTGKTFQAIGAWYNNLGHSPYQDESDALIAFIKAYDVPYDPTEHNNCDLNIEIHGD